MENQKIYRMSLDEYKMQDLKIEIYGYVAAAIVSDFDNNEYIL